MTYSPKFRGSILNVPGRQLTTTYVNGSGLLLAQCTPVCTNTLGQAIPIDVSDETKVGRLIGLLTDDLPMSASGGVTDAGRLEDVSLGFNVGDVLYVSKAGFLTSTKPSDGVDGFTTGDFVIFVGVVVKNEFDPLLKDLKLMLSVIGQL